MLPKTVIAGCPLEKTPEQELELPVGSKYLSVKNVQGRIVVFYICNADKELPTIKKTIKFIGMGQEISDFEKLKFLDVVVLNDGQEIVPIFEVK